MKLHVCLLLVAATLSWAGILPGLEHRKAFEEYKVKFHRNYSSNAEDVKRLHCFVKSLDRIEKLNKESNPVFGLNGFSDLCPEEFDAMYPGIKPDPEFGKTAAENHTTPLVKGLPSSYDFRWYYSIQPIQNQGACGSCWAFAAVASMEGAWAIKYGRSYKLSEEYLVQCDTKDTACAGGWPSTAVYWTAGQGGIPTASSYPYTHVSTTTQGRCLSKPFSGASFRGYGYFSSYTEAGVAGYLPKLLSPPFVVVRSYAFQDYVGGIFNNNCGYSSGNLHAILLVGFSPSSGGYWILRNSWIPDRVHLWGESGYMRMIFGSNCRGIMSLGLGWALAK